MVLEESDNEHLVVICSYHEYILEAASALRFGLQYYEATKADTYTSSDPSMELAQINCRYAFLMIVNSLESAANSLLHSISDVVYKENERKPTLDKFKLFCKYNKIQLFESDSRCVAINELITCRNEFVHP